MEKKQLTPPEFEYAPIDFRRKNLWLHSIDGRRHQSGDKWLALILSGTMIGVILLAYIYN